MGSFVGHKGCCWSIKLSSNSQRAITGSADFSAKIWNANTGTCLLTLPHEHIVKCVDLSPDGGKAITGGHEKKLKIWDVENLLSKLQSAAAAADDDSEGKNGDASAASTNGNGQQSNGNGQKDTAVPADVHKLLKQSEDSQLAHDGNIKSVIWDAPNSQIISAGEDRCINFWDLETLQVKEVIKVESAITSMERNHDKAASISLTYGNTIDFIDPQRCIFFHAALCKRHS